MPLSTLLTRQMIVPALAVGLVSGAVSGYAGWSVRGWRCDAALLVERNRAIAAEKALNEHVLGASLEYEQGRAEGLKEAGVRENTIREVYHDIQVPVECEPPAAVVGVLGDAVGKANARIAGKPAATVP